MSSGREIIIEVCVFLFCSKDEKHDEDERKMAADLSNKTEAETTKAVLWSTASSRISILLTDHHETIKILNVVNLQLFKMV